MAHTRIIAMALGMTVLAATARAAESPRTTWIKAKCAVCHGENGAGDTPQGRETHPPDLRAAETQKKSDGELRASIEKGHLGMPSFKAMVGPEQVSTLVYYIRSIALKK